jgi:hypothetical protein
MPHMSLYYGLINRHWYLYGNNCNRIVNLNAPRSIITPNKFSYKNCSEYYPTNKVWKYIEENSDYTPTTPNKDFWDNAGISIVAPNLYKILKYKNSFGGIPKSDFYIVSTQGDWDAVERNCNIFCSEGGLFFSEYFLIKSYPKRIERTVDVEDMWSQVLKYPHVEKINSFRGKLYGTKKPLHEIHLMLTAPKSDIWKEMVEFCNI